jgi:hypothetical protein
MQAEITVALVAAGVAFGTTIVTQVGQTMLAKKQHSRDDRQASIKEERELERVLKTYRDPLLSAADSFQSRLYNMVGKSLFSSAGRENDIQPSGRSYAVESTLYIVAEYLGWREILRREIQYIDAGNSEVTRRINTMLEHITKTLAQNPPLFGSEFQLYRVEQRAIGELVIEPNHAGGRSRCIGPAVFCERLEDNEFQRWLGRLQESDIGFEQSIDYETEQRLRLLQNWLVELMNELDPHGLYFPGKRAPLAMDDAYMRFSPCATAAVITTPPAPGRF